MLDREVSDVFAKCYQFYKANRSTAASTIKKSTQFKNLKKTLAGTCKALAALHAILYSEWKGSDKRDGYLTRADGSSIVSVPVHLVAAFPTVDAFERVYRISRDIKTVDESILCISGSLVMVRAASIFSDIDFCEYVPANSAQLPSAFTRIAIDNESRVLTSFKVYDPSESKFSVVASPSAFVDQIQADQPNRSAAKTDFIFRGPEIRPIEVTNLIIFCDSSWQSASMPLTFAAQEAVIDPLVVMPNNLIDPFEIGRYICWLSEQIDKYILEHNYIKALKRCLSLSRILISHEVTDIVKNYIQISPEFLEKEVSNLRALEAKLPTMISNNLGAWQKELGLAIRSAELDRDKLISLDFARKEIGAFTREISDTLFSAIGAQRRLVTGPAT